jgi:hypothetical protein
MPQIVDGHRHFRNTDVIERLTHYGFGSTRIAREKLTVFSLALLDVIEEMDKGDRLILDGIGTFEIQLEKWRWRYFPNNFRKKFMKSHPRRWRLVFTPFKELDRWLHKKCPDEIIEKKPFIPQEEYEKKATK